MRFRYAILPIRFTQDAIISLIVPQLLLEARRSARSCSLPWRRERVRTTRRNGLWRRQRRPSKVKALDARQD